MKNLITALLLLFSATATHAAVIIQVDIESNTITLDASGGGLDWNFTGANYRFGVSNSGGPADTDDFYPLNSLTAGPSSDPITPLVPNSALAANLLHEITFIEFRGDSPNPQNGWNGTLTMGFSDLSGFTLGSGTWSVTDGVANGGLTMAAIPEPTTYAAIAGLSMFILVVGRRRKFSQQ